MREAIETRAKVDESGKIMKLEHYCPWKEHLYELEEELSLPQKIKFCLYKVWNIPPSQELLSGAGRGSLSSACAWPFRCMLSAEYA